MTPIHSVLDTQAAARPEGTALVDHDGRRISFADLGAAVAEMAAALTARGLGPGDRLLILSENAAAMIGLVLAASRLGAVAVPVNARMTGPELDRIRAHADPRLTVFLTSVSPDEASRT